MALIECPECKNQVSDKADACPKCGYPIQKHNMIDKDLFESGNTIDFTYKDEPIYRAARVHFYATLGLILGILLLCFGILLLISKELIYGYISLGVGVILTVLSSIYLYIGKKMRIKAEKE